MALTKLTPGAPLPEWNAKPDPQNLLPRRPFRKYWTTKDGHYLLDAENDLFRVFYVRAVYGGEPQKWTHQFGYVGNVFLEEADGVRVPQPPQEFSGPAPEAYLDHYSERQVIRFYRHRDRVAQRKKGLPPLTRAGVSQAFEAAASKLLFTELAGQRETKRLLNVLLLELFGPPHAPERRS